MFVLGIDTSSYRQKTSELGALPIVGLRASFLSFGLLVVSDSATHLRQHTLRNLRKVVHRLGVFRSLCEHLFL